MIAGQVERLDSPKIYSHGKAYLSSSKIEQIGLYDVKKDQATLLANKLNGIAFDSLDDLIDKFNPHIVSICTPDDLHFSVASRILESEFPPKVVFIEKPICRTNEEIRELMRLERLSDSLMIVNHSRRFDDRHHKLRALIASMQYGRVIKINIDYYGGWQHLGVHVVDVVQFLMNAQIKIHNAKFNSESRYFDDPTLDVVGEVDDAKITISGFSERYYQLLDINIMFECGQIKLSDFGAKVEAFKKAVNLEGENILEYDHSNSGHGMLGCMESAITAITNYLDNGDKTLLSLYGLKEADITMQTIWSGKVCAYAAKK